jgi:hypothetical protein
MDSINPFKGRPASKATKATSATGSAKRNKSKTTLRKVTPAQAAETDKNPPHVDFAPKPITKTIPQKTPTTATPENPEESDRDPDDEEEDENYLSSHSTNLLEDSSVDTEPDSPLLSQPSPNDFYYGSRSRASLLDLFDKEVTPTSTPTTETTPKPKQELKTTPASAKAAPCKSSNAHASAAATAPETTKKGPTSTEEYDLSLSQEQAMADHLGRIEKAAEQKKRATTLASESKLQGDPTTHDTPVDGRTPNLVPPFKSANKVLARGHAAPAKAKTAPTEQVAAPKAEAASAPALVPTPKHNDDSIKAYERQLKTQAKIERKADNAVDTEAFIQATVTAFATHTNSKLITDAIAELTRTLHVLTLKVHDYQAKATKFRDLPNWIPRSCKSGFALSAPKDIPDDDPGLLQIREDVAAVQHTYETALRAAVRRKELLLLKKALHERREAFISKSLDIATNWLSLWLPKNAKLLRRTPLTIKEDQVVGIIFERLLNNGDGHDLRMDLNNFFNQELKFPHMLAAKLRAQPRFKSKEAPEKRIFRTRADADAEGMYPFTKVTWDPAEYERLEAAIRVIEKPLTDFLAHLCKETTFRFQEEYDAELEYKLAELKVEARLKKQAVLSAATATAKALAQARKATPESVQKTMDKMDRKMTQIQRTQQRQGDKQKTPASPTHNAKRQPKNSPGSRGTRHSAVPKVLGKGNANANGKQRIPRQQTPRPPPRQNKQKQPTEKTPSNRQAQQPNPKKSKQRQRSNKAAHTANRPNSEPAPPAHESRAEPNNAAKRTNADEP